MLVSVRINYWNENPLEKAITDGQPRELQEMLVYFKACHSWVNSRYKAVQHYLSLHRVQRQNQPTRVLLNILFGGGIGCLCQILRLSYDKAHVLKWYEDTHTHCYLDNYKGGVCRFSWQASICNVNDGDSWFFSVGTESTIEAFTLGWLFILCQWKHLWICL